MEAFVGIILAIPLGLIPAFIAKSKGHSFGLWWLYGWALFIVAIIHVFFIDDRTKINSQNSQYSTQNYYQSQPNYQTQSVNQIPTNIQYSNSTSTADELIKYKELLDSGVITQEDFDAKKKQLLNM